MNEEGSPPTESPAPTEPALAPLAARSVLGGVMMGLANLVPGISGGTMLLAAGVYPKFIDAIGDVTRLKFRKVSLVVLGAVVVSALLAIVRLAGPVKDLVVNQRWVMYSLFIGLTLGGVPVVKRLIGKTSPSVWIGAAVGFIGMALLAIVQAKGGSGGSNDGWIFMFIAGVAGAGAMILPGVSGGYLLLVLGAYVPILAGISAFKDALQAVDTGELLSLGLGLILPVGLGVVIGVVAISQLLRWLLHRFERPTLGVLLGLLLGAVVGLWPFVQGQAPQPGDTLKGQTLVLGEVETDQVDAEGNALPTPGLVFEDTGKAVEPDDWPIASFTPTALQAASSVGLILLGFGVTMLVDRVGREKPDPSPSP